MIAAKCFRNTIIQYLLCTFCFRFGKVFPRYWQGHGKVQAYSSHTQTGLLSKTGVSHHYANTMLVTTDSSWQTYTVPACFGWQGTKGLQRNTKGGVKEVTRRVMLGRRLNAASPQTGSSYARDSPVYAPWSNERRVSIEWRPKEGGDSNSPESQRYSLFPGIRSMKVDLTCS